MKINNQIMVAVAFGMAITASLAGKLYATSEYAQAVVNNNIYGYARTGQCVLADPDDLIGNGCTVSSTGSPCSVYIEVNGVGEWTQAFKSPIAMPYCALALRESY